MNLKMTDSEKESVTRVVTEAIKNLKSYGSIEEFSHLANLLYVYKKLTGENYEEVVHEDKNV
ncbi:hypothetical protein [Ornithinibacillus sp. JPR2-1]|uniref:hypothetical protein n=1 Tax=Ornithinibacillus sp. JPR2-1 TaxID=2094019 RepID=UPI0031D2A692